MNEDRPCFDKPGLFGAGRPRDANPAEAVELCRKCPYRTECLEQFAASNRPEHVPFLMVVAGLHDEHLRRAMRLVRGRMAA